MPNIPIKKLIALSLTFLSVTQSFANVGSHNNLSNLFDRVQTTHKQALNVGGIDAISYASVAAPPLAPQSKPQEPKSEAEKKYTKVWRYSAYDGREYDEFTYGWSWIQTPARFIMGMNPLFAVIGITLAIGLSPVALLFGTATFLSQMEGTLTRWRWYENKEEVKE